MATSSHWSYQPMLPVRLNLALENGAWGAFDTDIYLTYDYKGVWENCLERRAEAAEDREDN
ncbi:MAG: hypothetical protein R2792_12955 [Saprospiraceae bacterium]